MGDPVQEHCRHIAVAEHLRPFAEGQVCGDPAATAKHSDLIGFPGPFDGLFDLGGGQPQFPDLGADTCEGGCYRWSLNCRKGKFVFRRLFSGHGRSPLHLYRLQLSLCTHIEFIACPGADSGDFLAT